MHPFGCRLQPTLNDFIYDPGVNESYKIIDELYFLLKYFKIPSEYRAADWNPEMPQAAPEFQNEANEFIKKVKATFNTMSFVTGVTLTPAVGAFADWLKATIKSKYGTHHLGVRSSLFIGTG